MNWATHMLQLHLTNFIVIAEDEKVYQFLTNTTDLKGHVLRSSEFHRPFEAHGAHAFVEYDSKGFSWCSRPHYLLSVVRYGYTAIWIDSDAVLLRSPMHILPDMYDIVVTEDSNQPQSYSIPCSCFIVARPRPATLDLLRSWATLCGDATQDQHSLGAALNMLRGNVSMYMMPVQAFPNGFFMNATEVSALPSSLQPYWVHANWRVGKDAKNRFLIANGAWIEQRQDTFCKIAN